MATRLCLVDMAVSVARLHGRFRDWTCRIRQWATRLGGSYIARAYDCLTELQKSHCC